MGRDSACRYWLEKRALLRAKIARKLGAFVKKIPAVWWVLDCSICLTCQINIIAAALSTSGFQSTSLEKSVVLQQEFMIKPMDLIKIARPPRHLERYGYAYRGMALWL